jgi:hypothetical protein
MSAAVTRSASTDRGVNARDTSDRMRAVIVALGAHQRNAKLQLTVVLAPAEAVPGLYVHPDHRRRRRRPVVRSEFDV